MSVLSQPAETVLKRTNANHQDEAWLFHDISSVLHARFDISNVPNAYFEPIVKICLDPGKEVPGM